MAKQLTSVKAFTDMIPKFLLFALEFNFEQNMVFEILFGFLPISSQTFFRVSTRNGPVWHELLLQWPGTGFLRASQDHLLAAPLGGEGIRGHA